ncbi:hypothetical protein FRC09_012543 [Ceratobasidium sp. 395]|nr:hypothetical protein FRC09_012543 [Ceratobasidium sp. 395]
MSRVRQIWKALYTNVLTRHGSAELDTAERAKAERRRLGHRYYGDPDDDGYVSPPPPSSSIRPPQRGYYCDRREYD